MQYLVETKDGHKWGGLLRVSNWRQLFEDYHQDYLRQTLYDRKMLVIKGLQDLPVHTYWQLHNLFGRPWNNIEYDLTTEKWKCVDGMYYTEYGNLITQESIGNRSMPWHRDIPWHRQMRYPIRSLYPVKMTNGAGNTTTDFCDADVAFVRHPKDGTLPMLNQVTLKIQSWYQYQYKVPNPDTKRIPLVEQHPATLRQSVLLNSFGPHHPELEYSTPLSGTWILDAYDAYGKSIGLKPLDKFHKLVDTPDNVYQHHWELGDLVLFDNYSGIFHRRDRIDVPEGQVVERLFWRMNLHHYWESYA